MTIFQDCHGLVRPDFHRGKARFPDRQPMRIKPIPFSADRPETAPLVFLAVERRKVQPLPAGCRHLNTHIHFLEIRAVKARPVGG
jgi:hypothetical protein